MGAQLSLATRHHRMNSLLSLPVALLLNLFQYLNLNDKKSLSLCCSYLHKIISNPLQWSKARIVKKQLESELSLPRFLSIRKYSLLLELDLSDLKYQFIDQTSASQFLKYLQNNTNLKIVNFNNNNLAR